MRNGNRVQLLELIEQLNLLRSEMLALEAASLREGTGLHYAHRTSARNLSHYLALRRHDIRHLQDELASLGLSSLGRTESHVIAALQTVIRVLSQLAGKEQAESGEAEEMAGFKEGQSQLEGNTDALLGLAPEGRKVRIMVTMPSEAATDYELVRDLVLNGMNCMRVNCAHDGVEAWSGMIRNLRRAEKETGKSCKVEMDLAGPKFRTGPIEPGPAVLKYRPRRDVFGRVETPARIWLTPADQPETPPAACDAIVPVSAGWLARLKPQDRVRFKDTRGARRAMTITAAVGKSRWAAARQTAYLAPGLILTKHTARRKSARSLSTRIGPIPPLEQTLRLKQGDLLVLTRSLDPGRPAVYDKKKQLVSPARVGVTLPEFFECVRRGEPVWFDDGKIGGIITGVSLREVTVEITQARPTGEKLAAEKGINVPETALRVGPLTAKDLEVLRFVVEHADIVGCSFVRTEADVRELQARLAELGGGNLGIVLKIETRQAFDNLPRLLLAAMQMRAIGVMIARGDLAVECGFQRLAEVQEEILWICEAARMPVIWATQVLESLAKSGIPSRSEITDAAMGERAECVMLNKGPYMVEAVRILDDILRRMQAHQEKKRSKLRKLQVADAFLVPQAG
ncbi:MAG TPA: pyruvate kinase [Candidatus Acidoferrales bacterium]|nr:pyruvate kinase [Candidatus Acidoferrales bacterium]